MKNHSDEYRERFGAVVNMALNWWRTDLLTSEHTDACSCSKFDKFLDAKKWRRLAFQAAATFARLAPAVVLLCLLVPVLFEMALGVRTGFSWTEALVAGVLAIVGALGLAAIFWVDRQMTMVGVGMGTALQRKLLAERGIKSQEVAEDVVRMVMDFASTHLLGASSDVREKATVTAILNGFDGKPAKIMVGDDELDVVPDGPLHHEMLAAFSQMMRSLPGVSNIQLGRIDNPEDLEKVLDKMRANGVPEEAVMDFKMKAEQHMKEEKEEKDDGEA